LTTDNQQEQPADSKQEQPDTTTPRQRSQGEIPAPLKAVQDSPLGQQLADSAVMEKGVKPLSAFFQKFINDWTMNLQAGALAYNLLTTLFPLMIALLSIFGLFLGGLSGQTKQAFLTGLQGILPGNVASGVVTQIVSKLSDVSGPLGLVTILISLFTGSRLFILMENCFDIIYHQSPRPFLKQNLMAVGMLLIFALLIPVVIFTSTGPALFLQFLKGNILSGVPGSQYIISTLTVLGSLIVAAIFFEVIYVVVPNQKISLRASWRGALIAAIALQLFLTLFPFYATNFLKGYVGQVGFAIILLVFFYYFAVILLLGAQVNAFFAEGIQKTPKNVAGIVHEQTSHDPKPAHEQEVQAPPSHKPD
jgi:membrane protein